MCLVRIVLCCVVVALQPGCSRERCRHGTTPQDAGCTEDKEKNATCADAVFGCMFEGKCTQDSDGGWFASDDKDCALFSNACRGYGQCTARGGRCVATNNADCERSIICAEAETCRQAFGRCGFAAAGPDDCQKPRGPRGIDPCRFNGQCEVVGGVCAATDPNRCRASRWCQDGGQCTLESGGCIVGGDADCAASRLCSEFHRCVARGGKCVGGPKPEASHAEPSFHPVVRARSAPVARASGS